MPVAVDPAPLWEDALSTSSGLRGRLEAALADLLPQRRWFRSKGRRLLRASIEDVVRLPGVEMGSEVAGPGDESVVLLCVRAVMAEGAAELYVVPVVALKNPRAVEVAARRPHALLLLREEGALFDAAATGAAAGPLMAAMRRPSAPGDVLRAVDVDMGAPAAAEVVVPELEQSNTSLLVGGVALLKVYRRLDVGINPELEIGVALTRLAAETGTRVAPRVLGALEYVPRGSDAPDGGAALAIVQELVPNQGDAWPWALRAARGFLDNVSVASEAPRLAGPWRRRVLEEVPAVAQAQLGAFLQGVRRLGRRTAELHLALRAAARVDPAFAPERPTPAQQLDETNRARASWARCRQSLSSLVENLPGEARALAARAIAAGDEIDDLIARSGACPIEADRVRTHGDLHLGQVLVTGDDFMIIDFEGEPARPLADRRRKAGAPRDAMGMVRSFAYAGASASRALPDELRASRAAWAALFSDVASAVYLRAHLEGLAGSGLLPTSPDALEAWLRFYELEKVVYEVSYELDNRPDWVEIPLRGLGAILDRR